MEPPFPLFVD